MTTTTDTKIRIDYRAIQPATGGFGMWQAGAESFNFPPACDAGWDEYWETEDDARFWLESDGQMRPATDEERERYTGKTYDEAGGEVWVGLEGDGAVLVWFVPVMQTPDGARPVDN